MRPGSSRGWFEGRGSRGGRGGAIQPPSAARRSGAGVGAGGADAKDAAVPELGGPKPSGARAALPGAGRERGTVWTGAVGVSCGTRVSCGTAVCCDRDAGFATEAASLFSRGARFASAGGAFRASNAAAAPGLSLIHI